MKAPLSLRKPENWQDFETLCLMLWGEIWQCPEIKKFGRSGQDQHGVDIYGKLMGEKDYFGIQCKAKDEKANKKLTEREILAEIDKAESFPLPLRKLIVATTANKDVVIESFVLRKNEELQSLGKLALDLYCWEDIMLLIEQNQKTYNWYLDRQKYSNEYQAKVTFEDNSDEMVVKPKFKQRILMYAEKINVPDTLIKGMSLNKWAEQMIRPKTLTLGRAVYNHSYSSFKLKIHNVGILSIEEFKLLLKFKGGIADLAVANRKGESFIPSYDGPKDVNVNIELLEAKVTPLYKRILVPEDTYTSNAIFVKPLPKEDRITITWKLLSKSGSLSGEIYLNVVPDVKRNREVIAVNSKEERKTIECEIEDFIDEKV